MMSYFGTYDASCSGCPFQSTLYSYPFFLFVRPSCPHIRDLELARRVVHVGVAVDGVPQSLIKIRVCVGDGPDGLHMKSVVVSVLHPFRLLDVEVNPVGVHLRHGERPVGLWRQLLVSRSSLLICRSGEVLRV